jgi:hypothetical protein
MTTSGPVSRTSHECIIATTDHERDEVYRLRYACYRRKGSIDINPEERFKDPFDELESGMQ